ncbi:hypothetical protein IJH72_03080 [Candidatus Saccharibacteria bacterium]|nr:hypothetical protein [Candidatus Saccharibacteria bacterium]
MVDRETEKWAEKSKRIEAERMKAARALAEGKPDKSNLAYLDPKTTKVKGWTTDPDVILASIERLGNRAVVLAVSGIVLSIIGQAGGVISETFNLGLGSMIISGIPGGVGLFCMGLAVIMAIVVMGGEIFYKVKQGRKFSSAFLTAGVSIFLIVLYGIIQWLISSLN